MSRQDGLSQWTATVSTHLPHLSGPQAAVLAAFFGDPARVAEVFRVPNLNAALFFAGFMLSDPPTSPARQRDQLVYGGIVAAASAAIYLTLGGVYFLPGGLLVGNAWEAWRRWATGRRQARARRGAPPASTSTATAPRRSSSQNPYVPALSSPTDRSERPALPGATHPAPGRAGPRPPFGGGPPRLEDTGSTRLECSARTFSDSSPYPGQDFSGVRQTGRSEDAETQLLASGRGDHGESPR